MMWLPESLVGDGQTGQTGTVIIHDVVRSIRWTHDLQDKPEREGGKLEPGFHKAELLFL